MPETQLSLSYTCPRCGAPVPSLPDLAETALRVVDAMRRMRLVVPDVATQGMVLIATSLVCHAKLCRARPVGGVA